MSLDPLAAFAGRPFTPEEARSSGVPRRRIRSARVHAPFRGVRTLGPPMTPLELCRAYLPRMSALEFFSHITAAIIHAVRLPLDLEQRMALDVSVIKGRARAPRDPGIIGHHLVDRPGLVVVRRGMRVTDLVETLCQLATVLPTEDDIVVAAETFLLPRRASSVVLLERIVRAFSDEARPRSARLRRAAARIRIGSRSAQETRLRLMLVDAGLPEPAINLLWTLRGGGTVEGDLVYVLERVWIEYEGDQHRTDRKQWRKDLTKYERLTDEGWRVIRVDADDLRLRAAETIERVRRALLRSR